MDRMYCVNCGGTIWFEGGRTHLMCPECKSIIDSVEYKYELRAGGISRKMIAITAYIPEER